MPRSVETAVEKNAGLPFKGARHHLANITPPKNLPEIVQ